MGEADRVDVQLGEARDGPARQRHVLGEEMAGQRQPAADDLQDVADRQAIADLIKKEKVLETVAAVVTHEFVLAKPATLKGAICDEENAFYDPETSEVTLCYEYAQLYYDMIADPENAGAAFMEE